MQVVLLLINVQVSYLALSKRDVQVAHLVFLSKTTGAVKTIQAVSPSPIVNFYFYVPSLKTLGKAVKISSGISGVLEAGLFVLLYFVSMVENSVSQISEEDLSMFQTLESDMLFP